MFWTTSPLSVLRRDASALTVIVSFVAPTSSGTSIPSVWAAARLKPARVYFLKPEADTDTEYAPGCRLVAVYAPVAVETVGTTTPVSAFFTSTAAPAIVEPVGSVIVPVMVPLPACGQAATGI